MWGGSLDHGLWARVCNIYGHFFSEATVFRQGCSNMQPMRLIYVVGISLALLDCGSYSPLYRSQSATQSQLVGTTSGDRDVALSRVLQTLRFDWAYEDYTNCSCTSGGCSGAVSYWSTNTRTESIGGYQYNNASPELVGTTSVEFLWEEVAYTTIESHTDPFSNAHIVRVFDTQQERIQCTFFVPGEQAAVDFAWAVEVLAGRIASR